MNKLRLKEVLKQKGVTLEDVAQKIGITYVGLYGKIKTAKLETLTDIAKILNCDAIEFIVPPAGFQHEYTASGEWLGIYPTNGEKTPLYIKNKDGEIIKIGEVDKGTFKD